MSVDPNRFSMGQDPFDESSLLLNESVFSSGRVNVVVPAGPDEKKKKSSLELERSM